MERITLDISSVKLTDEQFFKLCRANETWKLEKTAKGELIVMSPVGGVSGYREADLIGALWSWNRQTNRGIVFSSSTIFRLPNNAARSRSGRLRLIARCSLARIKSLEQFNPGTTRSFSADMSRFCD